MKLTKSKLKKMIKEEIESIKEALKYIHPDRLWISPDCGLGMLPEDIAIKKVKIVKLFFIRLLFCSR